MRNGQQHDKGIPFVSKNDGDKQDDDWLNKMHF